MTVILGGGMSGLSAAYYATEKKLASLVLLEASDRLGGWVCSKKSPNGSLFEIGPRTIRPRGPAGKNTLNLIDDLKLTDKLIPIPFTHPSAKNRMIYVNNKLHLLPNSFGSLIATKEPFKRALINIWLNDVKAPKVTKDDESIYSFVERRMGKDVADYLISPMLCGICAGDAKKISVNFLMGTFFEAEQKYGSIMKGLLASKFEKIFSVFGKNKDKAPVQMQNEIVGLKSAKLAEKEQWSVWGLSGGLEQLPIRLSDNLKSRGVDMRLNEKCEKIKFVSDGAEIEVNNETRKCSRIISALSAKNLAQLVHVQHPQLAKELWGIPMVNVGVVNLEFPGNRLPMEAFGFLVPPMEKIPILGVIFDSCVFPSKSSTVLTVMMGGAWFQHYFGDSPTEDYLLSVALEQVKKILQIKVDPTSHNVAILKDCIPQYIIGHKQRLSRIQGYISDNKLPLALCGSSYQGVGLNDVILSAKQAVYDISQEKTV